MENQTILIMIVQIVSNQRVFSLRNVWNDNNTVDNSMEALVWHPELKEILDFGLDGAIKFELNVSDCMNADQIETLLCVALVMSYDCQLNVYIKKT